MIQTALDMLEAGRDVFVLADGISSGNAEDIGVAIAGMRQAGAVITTSESLLFQILGKPVPELPQYLLPCVVDSVSYNPRRRQESRFPGL